MNVLVNDESLKNIANAIRAKNGKTDTYKPAEMAPAIQSIEASTGAPDTWVSSATPLSYTVATADNNSIVTINGKVAIKDNKIYVSPEATIRGTTGYAAGQVTKYEYTDGHFVIHVGDSKAEGEFTDEGYAILYYDEEYDLYGKVGGEYKRASRTISGNVVVMAKPDIGPNTTGTFSIDGNSGTNNTLLCPDLIDLSNIYFFNFEKIELPNVVSISTVSRISSKKLSFTALKSMTRNAYANLDCVELTLNGAEKVELDEPVEDYSNYRMMAIYVKAELLNAYKTDPNWKPIANKFRTLDGNGSDIPAEVLNRFEDGAMFIKYDMLTQRTSDGADSFMINGTRYIPETKFGAINTATYEQLKDLIVWTGRPEEGGESYVGIQLIEPEIQSVAIEFINDEVAKFDGEVSICVYDQKDLQEIYNDIIYGITVDGNLLHTSIAEPTDFNDLVSTMRYLDGGGIIAIGELKG